MQEADASEEEVQNLEHAVRTTLLARARALRTVFGQSASVSFDLSTIFRSLGAMGQPLAIQARDLQGALVNMWRQHSPAASCLQMADNTANAAARKLAARLAGTNGEEGGMDYRHFEEWLCPPRGLAELRSKVATGGGLGGMTEAELFNQLRGCAIGGSRVENEGKVLGKLELRQCLGKLGLCLTESEINKLMEGAVCFSEDERHRGQFSPDKLHSLVAVPLAGHDRSHEAREGTLRIPEMNAVAIESRATKTQAASRALEPCQHSAICIRAEEECFTPDSLQHTASPPMLLSEVEVVKDCYAESTSSVFLTEHIRRKAAGVKARPTNIAIPGERPIGRRHVCDPESNVRGYDDPMSKLAEGNHETVAKSVRDKEVPDRTAHAWPYLDPITPPLGPALSPPEHRQSTRVSRECLEAVRENLDIKDHRKRIVKGTNRANVTRRTRSAGARLYDDSKGKRGSWQRETSPSAGRFLSTINPVSGLSQAKRSGNIDIITDGVDDARTPQVSEEGRRAATVESTATGVARSRLEADRGVGFPLRHKGSEMGMPGVARQDGYVSDEGISEYSVGVLDASEVIGRLRARVAEMELTEEVGILDAVVDVSLAAKKSRFCSK